MKFVKQFLSVLSAALLIISSFSVSADTAGDYFYRLNGGKITITSYIGSEKVVTVPSRLEGHLVTVIDTNAFIWDHVTDVFIPNSVITIGNKAFYECEELINITIPDSVTSIGNSIFQRCVSLPCITLPGSISVISQEAFSGCSSLSNATLLNGVASIGYSAFSGCTSLETIAIPDSVTSIGSSAFSGCSLLKIDTLPDSVTEIGDSAFSGCAGITTFTVPDSVTSIGAEAFFDCTNLKDVTIPDSVTNIGANAFSSCESIQILGKVGSYAEKYAAMNNLPFHDFDSWQSIEPTCTSPGSRQRICRICGEVQTEILPALGHEYGAWQIALTPTCTKSGSQSRICTRCGFVESVSNAPTGHQWQQTGQLTPTCEQEGYINYQCKNDATHTKQDTLPAIGHAYGTWQMISSPSCTQSGTNQRVCQRCSKAITQTVPALGHKWETTWTLDRPATATIPGEKSRHCSRCDERTDIITIPIIGDCPGDLDGNGQIDSIDALIVLRTAADKVVLDERQLAAADVDGVAGISASDALMILQYATKQISAFPANAVG